MRQLDKAWMDPLPLMELFLLANVGGIGMDIYVAHAVNEFRDPWEWAPIVFSAVATPVLLAAQLLEGLRPTAPGSPPSRPVTPRRRFARALGLLVGWGCVAIGVAGLVFHLESQFFRDLTIRSLVYTAPFAAPLAYSGVGLLIILDRMISDRASDWGRWVVLLTMGGFVGNFVLCLSDHAQNGFFTWPEWIGVVSAALAVGFLTAVVIIPADRPLLVLTLAVLALQVLVGVLGFGLHVRANVFGVMDDPLQNFIYGTPTFAPLLFSDVAVLGALGIWALMRRWPISGPVAEAQEVASLG